MARQRRGSASRLSVQVIGTLAGSGGWVSAVTTGEDNDAKADAPVHKNVGVGYSNGFTTSGIR